MSAKLRRERRRGGFFYEFLMAALNRAFAFAQMHDVAVFIAQHLNFDVARNLYVLFDVDGWIVERDRRFVLSRGKRCKKFVPIANDAHAATAAARRSFDYHRVAELLGNLYGLFFVFYDAVEAGSNRHSGSFHRRARLRFVAHQLDAFRARPDELDVASLADFRKVSVLCKEAVAGMNRINVRYFGGRDDRRNIQIALRRRRGADADGFVREAHVKRIAINFGMNGDGADAKLFASPDDARRNLASISYQDFFKH